MMPLKSPGGGTVQVDCEARFAPFCQQPFWLQRRLCLGNSGRTSSYVHRRVCDVVVVVIDVSVAAATTNIGTFVHFRASNLTFTRYSSDAVRTLPAVRRRQESPRRAAGALPARLLGRRTADHQRRAAVRPTRSRDAERGAATHPPALPAAARGRGTGRGCRCRCRRSDLDKTLAEVARVDDDADSPVRCCVCSLVIASSLPPSRNRKVCQLSCAQTYNTTTMRGGCVFVASLL